MITLSFSFLLAIALQQLIYSRQGQDFGDEYFAELDMIESVEGRKEGYESDVDEGEYYLQENDSTVIQGLYLRPD